MGSHNSDCVSITQDDGHTFVSRAIAKVGFVSGASGKSLGTDANEKLRATLETLVREQFEGNRAAAARRLGVSQSLVQEFLGGTRGAGTKLLKAISDFTHRPIDELMGRPALVSGSDPDVVHPVLGSRPGAHEALARAKRQEPWFPAFAWEDAMSTATLIAPAVVTPAMLVAAARLSMSVRSGEQLDEATMAQAEAEEADREARQIEAQRLVREAEARGEKLDAIKVMNDLRLRNQRAELDAAKARDAAHGTANDAPPAPANDGTKKPGKKR